MLSLVAALSLSLAGPAVESDPADAGQSTTLVAAPARALPSPDRRSHSDALGGAGLAGCVAGVCVTGVVAALTGPSDPGHYGDACAALGPVSSLGAVIGMAVERVVDGEPLLPALAGAAPGCLLGGATAAGIGATVVGAPPLGSPDGLLAQSVLVASVAGLAVSGPTAVGGAVYAASLDGP